MKSESKKDEWIVLQGKIYTNERDEERERKKLPVNSDRSLSLKGDKYGFK